MGLNTVIFDMDGLLIDSEPLWYQAAQESMQKLGISLDEDMYARTIGLRTKECLLYWFNHYNIDLEHIPDEEEAITRLVIQKVSEKGQLMDGVMETLDYFDAKKFSIGLATSSASSLIDAVLKKTGLVGRFHAISSAEHLAHGKPHPQVYLDCAKALGSNVSDCLCFEDSFNGMIAAKAAKMKCIVVPSPQALHHEVWGAADAKLSSLLEFDENIFALVNA